MLMQDIVSVIHCSGSGNEIRGTHLIEVDRFGRTYHITETAADTLFRVHYRLWPIVIFMHAERVEITSFDALLTTDTCLFVNNGLES